MKFAIAHLRSVAALLLVVCMSPLAMAHYLWVNIEKGGDQGTANVYFEEGPAPGDGHYLDPFVKAGKTWITTLDGEGPQTIEMEEKKGDKTRWLIGTLPAAGPRTISSYGKFGVYRYGKTDVLLHYYAKQVDVETHEDLHELARNKELKLDIVPHDHGDTLELTVLWQGKPAANRPIYVRRPGGRGTKLTTNEKGVASLPVDGAGSFRFRTFVEEDTPGEDEGMAYSLIRHNATLSMKLPLEK